MASAAVAFIRTFGMDEPMGCYDDFEHADAFVLWGSNMAEMHPILWTRVTDRRLSHPHVRIATLSTYEHRTTDLSDMALIFKPGTDLAILNYIANHIIQTGAVNREFVDKHVNFRMANTDIGYGLRPEHVLEQRAAARQRRRRSRSPSNFDAYAKLVSDYTLDHAAELTGVPKERLEALAKLYADPKTKVMSLWTMGFNQHVRGVWANHMVYNLHLLTGKIAEPGNSPFSLTGQPSACGTAREVGTFAHRLPADMLVTNPEHRKHAEEIWKLPARAAAGQDRLPRRAAGPHAEGRQAQRLLDHVQQQPPDGAEHQQRDLSRLPQSRRTSSSCSDPYPTVTAMAADLVLPTAMWVEKEGAYGNAERRTHFWHQLVNAPGEARSDLWQLMEFSKRFTTDEVWPAEILRCQSRTTGARRCSTCSSRTVRWTGSRCPRLDPDYENREVEGISASTSRRACSRNTPASAAATATTSRPSTPTIEVRGLRWPVVERQGDALALPRGPRPLCREGQRAPVLRQPRQAGRTSSAAPTSRRPRPRTRSSTSGWSPAACWSTGIPAR